MYSSNMIRVEGRYYLNDRARKALARHVRHRVVCDLGAGDYALSKEMIDLGADHVFAFDQRGKKLRLRHITPQRAKYCDLVEFDLNCKDVCVLSWPPVDPHLSREQCECLIEILRGCKTIIYIGVNYGLYRCGRPMLYDYLWSREVKEYEPDSEQTLIVYGRPVSHARPITPEEAAGITLNDEDFGPLTHADAAEIAQHINHEVLRGYEKSSGSHRALSPEFRQKKRKRGPPLEPHEFYKKMKSYGLSRSEIREEMDAFMQRRQRRLDGHQSR